MRIAAAVLVLCVLPLAAQQNAPLPYKLIFEPNDPKNVVVRERDAAGNEGLFVTVKFVITLEGEAPQDATTYKVVIEENGKRVKEEDVPRPTPSEEISAVLAMDISGSMSQEIGLGAKKTTRIDQARRAADLFFTVLPAKADAGLILFDHEMRVLLPPPTPRALLKKEVENARPMGGTAYLDATAKGVEMLAPFRNKERALVVMTDGVDLNSDKTLEQVIALAKQSNVRVYTVGIGEAGRNEPVTSILVLDKSGSMLAPADDEDKVLKIEAMKTAAGRFINGIGPTGRSALVEFSDSAKVPAKFSNEKFLLKNAIKAIHAQGETALFDGIYEGLATIDAENPRGKRAVVALTDGIDNKSRRRVEEVIERAKESNIAVYLLGFGRPGELDEKVMQRIADQTGGKYYHAKNEKALIQIFENLSQQIHDDGIDEAALKSLAKATGGDYYHARDLSKLDFILTQVSKSLQRKEYTVTFPSGIQKKDGTLRNIAIKLVRRTGELASNVTVGSYTPGGKQGGEVAVQTTTTDVLVEGLVVSEVSHSVYLGLLAIMGVLIALPSVFRRRPRGA